MIPINAERIKVTVEVTVVDLHFWWFFGIDGKGRIDTTNDIKYKMNELLFGFIWYVILIKYVICYIINSTHSVKKRRG